MVFVLCAPFHASVLNDVLESLSLIQWFSICSPQTISVSITWGLVRNVDSDLENLGWAPGFCEFIRPPGDSVVY